VNRTASSFSRRGRGEDGVSIIEMLVAMVVLTTAIIALVGGIGTSIIATDAQRKNVTSDGVARTWAEKLQLAPYTNCAPSGQATYQPANLGVTVPPKYSAQIVSIEYWDGNATAGFTPSCGTDLGVQRITLSVRSTDNRGVARIAILKRRT
jgi:Tfp pilus assembly protein PilV